MTIYNQGISDRIATMKSEEKDYTYIRGWFDEHQGRYAVLVAVLDDHIIGWASLNQAACVHQFHKIVLFTFPFNGLGQGLYKNCGYREVGVFHNQGILDGNFVDVIGIYLFYNTLLSLDTGGVFVATFPYSNLSWGSRSCFFGAFFTDCIHSEPNGDRSVFSH